MNHKPLQPVQPQLLLQQPSMSFRTPIIINNFNRLTTTKKLVEDLYKLGYCNIHILDNNSTYKPLLEWYKTNPCVVKRLKDNLEGLSIYNSQYINEFLQDYKWVCYTDSDIELNENTPKDFVEQLIGFATTYGKLKAGLALRIDDLPETFYAHFTKVHYENRNWDNSIKLQDNPPIYSAPLDTTFCIIRPDRPFDYQAIRVAGEFTAYHKPWYFDWANLDKEEQYYLKESKEWSTYSRLYHTWLKEATTYN
jgi:hypothetical protein